MVGQLNVDQQTAFISITIDDNVDFSGPLTDNEISWDLKNDKSHKKKKYVIILNQCHYYKLLNNLLNLSKTWIIPIFEAVDKLQDFVNKQ